MSSISQFLYSRSNLKIALGITAVFSLYLVLVFMGKGAEFAVADSDIRSLGTTCNFTTKDVVHFFSIRTTDMIQAYIAFNQIWDSLFGVLYGTMYAVWISVICTSFAQKTKILNLFPFVQVLFDWIENYQLVVLSKQYLATGRVEEANVVLASTASMIKWGCSGIVMLLIVGGLIFRMISGFRKAS